MKMSASQTRSDAGLATELRISVSRLARRLRAERIARGLATELSDTQLGALAALEARGLVTRAPHPTDGRQVRLTVTEQGRDLVQQSRKLRQEWMHQRLRELSPEERAILRAAAPVLQRPSPAFLRATARRATAWPCSGRCGRATTDCSPPARSSPIPAAG